VSLVTWGSRRANASLKRDEHFTALWGGRAGSRLVESQSMVSSWRHQRLSARGSSPAAPTDECSTPRVELIEDRRGVVARILRRRAAVFDELDSRRAGTRSVGAAGELPRGTQSADAATDDDHRFATHETRSSTTSANNAVKCASSLSDAVRTS